MHDIALFTHMSLLPLCFSDYFLWEINDHSIAKCYCSLIVTFSIILYSIGDINIQLIILKSEDYSLITDSSIEDSYFVHDFACWFFPMHNYHIGSLWYFCVDAYWCSLLLVIHIHFLEKLWCSLCFFKRYLLHTWYAWSLCIHDILHSLTMTVCLSSVLDQCVSWICEVFLIMIQMSCLSVLYIGKHWFFIFPHFCEIAMAWYTPMSIQMCIVCLLIQMFLDEIMGVCLSLVPYLFCVCVIVFVIMWFPAFGNTTV